MAQSQRCKVISINDRRVVADVLGVLDEQVYPITCVYGAALGELAGWAVAVAASTL